MPSLSNLSIPSSVITGHSYLSLVNVVNDNNNEQICRWDSKVNTGSQVRLQASQPAIRGLNLSWDTLLRGQHDEESAVDARWTTIWLAI